ncbi:MAG: gamma-glutamylcyclotransferase [Gammaproteobacteria bacterium]|nr:gamma-glutamylcyclotransferase [Gammaproteobacteria bacterium]
MTWIFGYGSLIWRPAFPFKDRRKAVVRGWRRRVWQASPDPRGVPEAPGRVVTLVEETGAVCWGMAFLLDEGDRRQVMSELDLREKNGYEPINVDLEFDDGSVRHGLTYVAGQENPSFVGPAPMQEMIAQIANAIGPSGPNVEYLTRLADTLDGMDVYDEEVHGLREALHARGAN